MLSRRPNWYRKNTRYVTAMNVHVHDTDDILSSFGGTGLSSFASLLRIVAKQMISRGIFNLCRGHCRNANGGLYHKTVRISTNCVIGMALPLRT